MTERTCSVAGCVKPYYARGWCNAHWWRHRRTGSPTGSVPRQKRSAIEAVAAIRARVTDDGGCHIFEGADNGCGYGDLGSEGRVFGERLVHRVLWVATHGPIPDGLTIDHLCRVRRCCNPAHLEPVTRGENTRRAHARRG